MAPCNAADPVCPRKSGGFAPAEWARPPETTTAPAGMRWAESPVIGPDRRAGAERDRARVVVGGPLGSHKGINLPARTLRVARTIADLDGAERIAEAHLAEALAWRPPQSFR